MDKRISEVLDFWLKELGPQGWYAGGAALDATIRDRFLPLWQEAAAGGLAEWCRDARGALAYLIVTDQFPRNIFRNDARAFATDGLALEAAENAVAAGFDRSWPEPERQFFYLPFMHSEDPAMLARCEALMAAHMPDTGASNRLHAKAHAEVVRRFGRFPYRNAALGRQNSADEERFLTTGGYGAIVEEMRDEDA